MNVKKILVILVLSLIILNQSCFSAISNDWTCVPGQRVGPITKETNEKTLIKAFGNQNIKNVTISRD